MLRLLRINLITYLILNLTSNALAERCLISKPYCNCEHIDSPVASSSITNTSIYQLNGIYLNCTEITNASVFLTNLYRDLPEHATYNLIINQTRHQIVNSILDDLILSAKNGNDSRGRLVSNLNGLILFNLSDIEQHTFDFDLTEFTDLAYLNITANQVDYLNCSRFSSSLQVVDLSKNELKSVFGCSLVGDFRRLTNLDLSRNHLTFFELTKLNELQAGLEIDLTTNDWDCTNDLQPLIELVNSNSSAKVTFLDPAQLKCKTPKKLANLIFKQVVEIRDLEICSKCECYSFRGNILALNCENRGLTELPRKLPWNTKIVNLDRNSIESLSLKGIGENEKQNWMDVIRLSVRHNKISALDDADFDQLQAVRQLNLTHNRLNWIPKDKLNRLSKMDVVKLGFNPWICNCNTINNTELFQRWLRATKQVDLEDIRCNDKLNGPPIYKLDKNELCSDKISSYYWNCANIVLSVLIVLLITKLLYDYIWKLKTGKLPYFFKMNC